MLKTHKIFKNLTKSMRLYPVPWGLLNFQSNEISMGNLSFQDDLKDDRIEKLSIEQRL